MRSQKITTARLLMLAALLPVLALAVVGCGSSPAAAPESFTQQITAAVNSSLKGNTNTVHVDTSGVCLTKGTGHENLVV